MTKKEIEIMLGDFRMASGFTDKLKHNFNIEAVREENASLLKDGATKHFAFPYDQLQTAIYEYGILKEYRLKLNVLKVHERYVKSGLTPERLLIEMEDIDTLITRYEIRLGVLPIKFKGHSVVGGEFRP